VDLLAKINANKSYSDLVESLLGTIWVDSGSLDACKQAFKRMGMFKLMHRLIKDRVHALHPREELCILAGDKEVKYNVQKNERLCCEWMYTVCVGQSQVFK
jgi:dsRNA-specific ribonuclease